MNAVTPSYYLVHPTPVGQRYAYPRSLIPLAVVDRYASWPPTTPESLTVSEPAGTGLTAGKHWLITDAPIVELRREQAAPRVLDGWMKRDQPSMDGPVSPDMKNAFDAAPQRPGDAEVAHFAEHDAAHACWVCAVFAATYGHHFIAGEPVITSERLDGWLPLSAEMDPDPDQQWAVDDPSLLAIYGAHTAHLWPGSLPGLRKAIAERLKTHPMVSNFYDWHESGFQGFRGFSITVRVPWETHRRETKNEKHPGYPRRKARPVTRDVWAMTVDVKLAVSAGLHAPTKAAALDGFDASVERVLARFFPFGLNPRACDHCGGTGRVSADA